MSNCCAAPRDTRDKPLPSALAAPQPVKGAPANLIMVPGGRSFVGTNRPEIPQDGEGPKRDVVLADFGLEAQTVTVARFADFVAGTGYVTEAERLGWSIVFFNDQQSLAQGATRGSSLPWWHRVDGACWRAPEGASSDTSGREDHPVTHVSWADAHAFSQWVGGRLPTEAEWEHAARGGSTQRRFPWGDEEPDDNTVHANIWQGDFPVYNSGRDGYERTAPARSFAPNPLGFYNLAGNVWEWTQDSFRIRSVSKAARQRNAEALSQSLKVLKGGSFLCHASYCYRYRIAARMGLPPDNASSNVGFRVAV
jgi:Uncharacterized conserved protein